MCLKTFRFDLSLVQTTRGSVMGSFLPKVGGGRRFTFPLSGKGFPEVRGNPPFVGDK